jgi:2-desacetyl-2-hydroxyethyl bacteriochlorophyllide A dehydrogenase
MRALVLREHGGPESLRLEPNFPEPQFAPDEVLLRVRATALNFHDVLTCRGMPGIKIPFPIIPGIDVAGEIVACGSAVEGWQTGDRVLVDPRDRVTGDLMGETRHGGLAEFCSAPARQLIRIPPEVTDAQAAMLPAAYGAAHRMVATIGRIQPGETVLVIGASGGVGSGCIQLARLAGAEVVAVVGSRDKGAVASQLGAAQVIRSDEQDLVTTIRALYGKPERLRGRGPGGGVDVVINNTGGPTWTESLRCLRHGGRLLTCGASAGFDPKEDLRHIWTFELQILGSNEWEREDLVALLELVRAGRLATPIDRICHLDEAPAALADIAARQVTGKIVVTPA